eukprot:2533712-Rhodomonas_salina.3
MEYHTRDLVCQYRTSHSKYVALVQGTTCDARTGHSILCAYTRHRIASADLSWDTPRILTFPGSVIR